MAYTATITYTKVSRVGANYHKINVAETDARDTSETGAITVPEYGRIVSTKTTLSAGTGSKIDPNVGVTAGWVGSTQDEVLGGVEHPAAFIHEVQAVYYYAPSGQLFLRSTVNSTVEDHVIDTEFLILEGW